jgi:hypothetical protein
VRNAPQAWENWNMREEKINGFVTISASENAGTIRARLFLRITGMNKKQAIAHLLLMGELQVAVSSNCAPMDISFRDAGQVAEEADRNGSGKAGINGLIRELRSI